MLLKQFKNSIFFIIKLGITAAVVWYLLLRDTSMLAGALRNFDVRALAPAVLLFCIQYFINAFRWRRLALMLGIELGRFEAFSLTLQGNFFSMVIPGGAIGGDVVKMAVLSRRTRQGNRIEGAFTVLMDRIVGMIALFLLILVIVPFATELIMKCEIPGIPIGRNLKICAIAGVIVLSLSGIIASGVVFCHEKIRKIAIFNKLLNFCSRLTGGMSERLEQAADTYSGKPGEITLLTILSVLGIHLLSVLPMCILLSALKADYSIFTVVCAVTLGNLAALFPLFPSGIGGRDLVTVTILSAGAVPVADAKSAQLIYTAIIILLNLVSGAFFVFDRGRKKQKTELELS